MPKVVVFHAKHNCDIGCCGHVVSRTNDMDQELERHYFAEHAEGASTASLKRWAKELVTRALGAQHVTELDWSQCNVAVLEAQRQKLAAR